MIFSKKNRLRVQEGQKHLDKMRKKSIRSIKDQLDFVNTKYPRKMKPFEWKWSTVPKIILNIGFFLLLLYGYRYLFGIWGIELRLWQSILFVILFPILINLVLQKFNIQRGDLSVFFK